MEERTWTAAAWLGGGVSLLGAAVLTGFAAHIAKLAQVAPGRDASMAISSAVCLVLAGLALMAPALGPSVRKRLPPWLAGLLIAIGGASLAENLFDLNLGVDLPHLHYWLADPALRPGRMAPNTSVGFLLFAAAMLALPHIHSRRGARSMRVLTGLVAAVGASGILGYFLHIEAIYTFHGIPAMAPYEGAGLIALACGLWMRWREARWNRAPAKAVPGRRILSATAAVLIAVVAAAGISSLVLLRHLAGKDADTDLSLRRDERIYYIRILISEASARGEELAGRLDAPALLGNRRASAPSRLGLPSRDTFAVTLLDAHQQVVATAGAAVRNPEVELPLPLTPPADLLWSDGFYLRQHIPVGAGGKLGTVVVEQPLPLLASIGVETSAWGQSGEMGLCGLATASSRVLECFPQRMEARAFTLSRELNGATRPMALALQGETGVEEAPDYRRQRVLAAYSPIPGLGLGLVVKMDTTELYASIRRQIEIMLPLLVALTVGGLELMRWQVRPLVRQLVVSRNQALTSEARFRAAAESSLDALYIFESARDPATGSIRDFRLAYANHNGERLAALPPSHAAGIGLAELAGLAGGGFLEKFTWVVDTRQPLDEEFAMPPRDGPPQWLHHQAVALGDGVAATVRDITERKLAEERLRLLAQHDSLTGLSNRRTFLARLEHAMASARRLRHQALVALLYLDIDRFKEINDTWGHAEGDRLLKAFAARLGHCVRSADTVARMGGDEFTVLLENLDGAGDAERVVACIFAALQPPIALRAATVTATASVGMALFRGEEISADELLRRADAALYAAKRAGRNDYRVYAA